MIIAELSPRCFLISWGRLCAILVVNNLRSIADVSVGQVVSQSVCDTWSLKFLLKCFSLEVIPKYRRGITSRGHNDPLRYIPAMTHTHEDAHATHTASLFWIACG